MVGWFWIFLLVCFVLFLLLKGMKHFGGTTILAWALGIMPTALYGKSNLQSHHSHTSPVPQGTQSRDHILQGVIHYMSKTRHFMR